MLDGWVDAIADAVDDDDNTGPAFDPFGHKLVRRIMADYLERIATARADIARLKGEKEAFEQSNASDDLEEEELAGWNYARDLERQIKELKAGNREALKELAKLEKVAAKLCATLFDRQDAAEARARLQPALDQIAQLEAALVPYEQVKADLTAARTRYRELINRFVEELKFRCSILSDDEKESLVLELFAQDVQSALESAVAERRQTLVRFIEGLWDKYVVTLNTIISDREKLQQDIATMLRRLGY